MHDIAAKILRESIDRAEAAGFALLKRIPASERYHYLDYYSEIDPIERSALKDAHASRGAACLGFPPSKEAEAANLPVLNRQANRRGWSGNWRYLGVRELRLMRSIVKADPNHSIITHAPKEALDKIASVETAKAPELRKVAKIAFSHLLGAKPIHRLGVWEYSGKLNDHDVIVRIDYGGRSSQIRYELRLPQVRRSPTYGTVNYEALHGFGFGWWDQIEEGKEDQAFAVMTGLVRETIDLAVRIYEETQKAG